MENATGVWRLGESRGIAPTMNRIAPSALAIALALTSSLIIETPAVAAPARSPEQLAAAALRAAPVWDGHNDVPEQLRERRANILADFDFRDTTGTATAAKGAMHTDLVRLRKGQVGAQFWSVYVDASLPEPEAVRQTLEQIDIVRRLVAQNPRDLQWATSAADVERAWKAGRIASLIGMEGGASIGGSLAVLRQMHALGARYMTLAHFKTTAWADSATDAPRHGGLTEFGKDVVREMQRLGMLVDLSHVAETTMMDALDVAGAPVIFSHSGAQAINRHPRNVPDTVLSRLKGNGGIVMIVGLPGYLDEDIRIWSADRKAEEARLKSLNPGDPDKAARELKAWTDARPEPKATVSDMADHVDHIRRVAGIDHIGLGGDYDGMDRGPVGMEDVSGYPALFVELARRGYSQSDLEKIASRNMMRVLRSAEAYADAHRGDPPIESKAFTTSG